ncbi:MAG: helix-turn-helix domain-containing protein [Acidobacteriota bacterium]
MPSAHRIPVDAYVLDTLMADLVGHDRQPSAFLVYLCLWSRTAGATRPRVRISLAELAELTGLSRRSVQDALTTLVKRKLLSVMRETITDVPAYTLHRPWASRVSSAR